MYVLRPFLEQDEKALKTLMHSHELPCYLDNRWSFVLRNVYAKNMQRWGVFDENQSLVGLCLAYENNSQFYTSYFGFFAHNEDVAKLLFAEIDKFCKTHKIATALLTSGTNNMFYKQGNVFEKSNMIWDLKRDNLWDSVPKKTRNMIRKAEKSGFEISQDWEHFEQFYNIYVERMKNKNLNYKPQRFFEALKNNFGDDLMLFTLLCAGKVQAGMIFMQNENTVSYLYNASTERAQNSGGNNFLIFKAAQYYKETGKKFMELGESTENSPVFNFKKRISDDVKIVPVYYMRRVFDQNLLASVINFFINKRNGFQARAAKFINFINFKPNEGRIF